MSAATVEASPQQAWLSTVFHFFVYYLLLSFHRLRVLCNHVHAWIGEKKQLDALRIPRHIALSGAIATDLQHVCQLIDEAYMNGVEHVSLHDPWTELNVAIMANFLKERALPFHLCEIGGFGTRQVHSDPSCGRVSDPRISNHEENGPVVVTVVRANAGRATLVRAARQLALDESKITIEHVINWLDCAADGMLPSEPDVLVVFPGGKDVRANVLHGFPPWQLRLTQIRFSPVAISQMQCCSFLSIVSGAAIAPKRFGR